MCDEFAWHTHVALVTLERKIAFALLVNVEHEMGKLTKINKMMKQSMLARMLASECSLYKTAIKLTGIFPSLHFISHFTFFKSIL